MSEVKLRKEMVLTGRSLFSRCLTAGSSGNLSVRLSDGWLITPTNASLGDLDPARIAKLDFKGNLLSGDPPSKEAPIHLAMYEARPSDYGIVHLHSTYSAAVSCLAGLDADNCIPPLTAYFVMKVHRLPLVPYFRPGAPELAGAVRQVALDHHAILLANHGPVVSGTSLRAAVNAIEELEETAKLFLLLKEQKTSPLTTEQIETLKRVFNIGIS